MQDYELKLNVVEKSCLESISPKIKVAVLPCISLQELQDIIALRTDVVEKYATVKEVILNFIDNLKSHYVSFLAEIGRCSQQCQRSKLRCPRLESIDEQHEDLPLIGKGASC